MPAKTQNGYQELRAAQVASSGLVSGSPSALALADFAAKAPREVFTVDCLMLESFPSSSIKVSSRPPSKHFDSDLMNEGDSLSAELSDLE